MKSGTNFIFAIIQGVIGVLILTGHAGLNAIAWYYVIFAGFVIVAASILGILTLIKEDKSKQT